MIAYTDYPLFESEYGKKAPVREVEVTKYDGDKYCIVEYGDNSFEVKLGYLYKDPTLTVPVWIKDVIDL